MHSISWILREFHKWYHNQIQAKYLEFFPPLVMPISGQIFAANFRLIWQNQRHKSPLRYIKGIFKFLRDIKFVLVHPCSYSATKIFYRWSLSSFSSLFAMDSGIWWASAESVIYFKEFVGTSEYSVLGNGRKISDFEREEFTKFKCMMWDSRLYDPDTNSELRSILDVVSAEGVSVFLRRCYFC